MNLQKMLKQAQEMQAKITDMQTKLEGEESEGSAGGGMVRVRINGKGHALNVTLDPAAVTPDDREMLEDLIVAAFNDAKSKMETTFAEKMGSLTAGMNLPPGFKLPM